MKKPGKKTQKPNEARLLACMDYLHGEVVDGELVAACDYEYAAESETLREAARLRKTRMDDHEICFAVESKFRDGEWFIQHPWSFIWRCPSFPEKSWNQLSELERQDLYLVFPTPPNRIQPLAMNELLVLDAMGVLNELKEMVAAERSKRKRAIRQPQSRVFPIIEGWPPSIATLEKRLARLERFGKNSNPTIRAEIREIVAGLQKQIQDRQKRRHWVHAMFTLDFRKPKKRLCQEFEKWLRLPENEQRFKTYRQCSTGKTGIYKDRLKDLAAWRLYRELGCEDALKFAENNRKRSRHGKPRPFHDPRQGQSQKVPLNQAPLFSEESGFQKAEARALKYRAQLLPWEFGIYAEQQEELKREIVEVYEKELARLQKISKSSS